MIEAIAVSTMKTPNATQISEHTRRIVGMRLLPFLFILYIVNYVDRTNLAYAAMGMSRDLGFGDHVKLLRLPRSITQTLVRFTRSTRGTTGSSSQWKCWRVKR